MYTLGEEFSRTSEIARETTLLKTVVSSERSQDFLKVERAISEESQWIGQGSSGEEVHPLQRGNEGGSIK